MTITLKALNTEHINATSLMIKRMFIGSNEVIAKLD